ncbi:hypothetical protein M8C21_000154, partial [Ambrosia artemisiifolia]
SSLLHRYRDDRRKLLDFILSSSALIPSSSSSDIDFDSVSADYIHSQGGHAFFLLSDPDSAGSPPQHAPPSVEASYDRQQSSVPLFFSNGSEATVSGHDLEVNHSYAVPSSSKSAKKTDVPSLGLPALRTGLSDDDLRESAYEVLLSCIAFSGIAIHSSDNPKKDKGSRFLTGLKNRRGRRHLRSHSVENQFEHIDNIRVQMQISEAMDECIRQRLMQFSMRKSHVQADIPQIFGINISHDKKANVLEELFYSVNYPEMQELGILLDKIRNPEEWNVIMTPAERAEVLLAIRQVASSLSSMRGSSHIQGGSNYWNAGYHLNIRLYERLLFGVFDILDEGQLIEIELGASNIPSNKPMKPVFFRKLVLTGLTVGTDSSGIENEVKASEQASLLTNLNATGKDAAVKVRVYVERSLKAACRRKPFLDNVSLSEDAISVLSAAHNLEHYLIQAFNSKDGEDDVGSFFIHEIDFYQSIYKPLGFAEIKVWEPLSNQQKQAASVVEVFRIVEETVDQLFGLNLPMDISHLQALLSIIFHALDGYLQNLVSQLVHKNHLYPAAPPLTRYKETMFPIVKKQVLDSVILDEEVDEKLKGLTAAKLCVRLNTLEYMQKQIDILEDGIKKSWASTMVLNQVCGLIEDTLRDMVVASICRAALEGYVWVLLDGGPSCAFSDSDITMMEEDLNMLK